MSKAIKILTILLVLQVLLVVVTNLDQLKSQKNHQHALLLPLDWTQVDSLRIAGKDSVSVLIKKQAENKWVLPNYYDLPVDNNKIDELLSKLKSIRTDWPVATSEEAAKRFEVSEESFQRQITFLQGEVSKLTLFTGTSPGHRKVHAKLSDQNKIYSIDLSNFLASAVAEDWIKKQLFALDLNQIKQISLKEIQLTKADKEWLLGGISSDQKLNHSSLQNLLDALTNFRVDSALGTSLDADQLKNKITTLTYDEANEKQSWDFYEPKEEAHLILKTSKLPVYFKINRAEAEKITSLTIQQLVEPVVKTIQTPSNPLEPIDSVNSTQTDALQKTAVESAILNSESEATILEEKEMSDTNEDSQVPQG